jgi:hypothetical protein
VERDVSEELDEATADPGVAAGIPQFFDLFRPLLEVLADGSDWKLPDAAEVVADAIGVGEEARTLRLRSGRLLFENRIRWAFTCLSKAELAELVGPSTVRITNDGRAVVQTEARIDRDFLLQTRPTYAAWHVDMGIEEPRPAEGEAAGGVWMVRAGRGGVYAPQFVTKSAAIVGWGETGDVSGLPREAIADRVSEAFPGDGARQRGQATNTLYHVVDSMQSGDLVVTPEPASRTLLLGRVSGPYQYLDDPPAPSYSHAREVRWFARVSRDELSYGARNSLGSMLTLSRPGHQGELLRLAENHADDGSPEPLEQTRRASPEPEPVLVPVAIPATASVPKRTALAEFQTSRGGSCRCSTSCTPARSRFRTFSAASCGRQTRHVSSSCRSSGAFPPGTCCSCKAGARGSRPEPPRRHPPRSCSRHSEVLENRVLGRGSAPVVVEAEPVGEGAGADQLECRERLSGAVQCFEDRADRLELGGLRQDRDGERVVAERLDIRLLHVVEKRPQAICVLIATHPDDAVDPPDRFSVADPCERHHQRGGLGLDRCQRIRTVGC